MKEKLKESMNGKICLVTGATNGIGKATALALAQKGATVVIVGRNPTKCAAVVSEIKHISGNELAADAATNLACCTRCSHCKTVETQLVSIRNGGHLTPKSASSDHTIQLTSRCPF